MKVRMKDYVHYCFTINLFIGLFTHFFSYSLYTIVYGSNPFNWFWLADPSAPCSLCGTNRMWTFIIVPIVSIISSIFFTFLDITIRGQENARKSMFKFNFDEKKKASTSSEVKESNFQDDNDDGASA